MTAPANRQTAQQVDLVLLNTQGLIGTQYAEFAKAKTESEVDALTQKLQTILTNAKSDIAKINGADSKTLQDRIKNVESKLNDRISFYSASALNIINRAAKRKEEIANRQQQLEQYPNYKEDPLFSQMYNQQNQNDKKFAFDSQAAVENAYLAAKKAQNSNLSSDINISHSLSPSAVQRPPASVGEANSTTSANTNL